MQWSYDVNGGEGAAEFHGDPLVSGGTVFVGTDSARNGAVWAFDLADGTLRWRSAIDDGHPHDQGVATRIGSAANTVCGASFEDELLCLDAKTGAVKWTFRGGGTPGPGGFRPSPAFLADRILYPGLDDTVSALDAVSGKVLWKRKLPAGIRTSIVASQSSAYVGSDDGQLYQLDTTNGAVRASIELGARPFFTPLLHAGKVYVFAGTDDRNELLAIDAALKKVLWRQATEGGWASPRPGVFGSSIVAGSERGDVIALDSASGKMKWSQHLGGVIRAIGNDGDVLFAGALSGRVTALRPPPSAR